MGKYTGSRATKLLLKQQRVCKFHGLVRTLARSDNLSSALKIWAMLHVSWVGSLSPCTSDLGGTQKETVVGTVSSLKCRLLTWPFVRTSGPRGPNEKLMILLCEVQRKVASPGTRCSIK